MNLLLTLCLCAAPPQDLPPAQQQRPEPLPIPRGIVLERGERRIVIDGSLQDWPKLPAVLLDDVRQLSGSALGAYRGRGDIAARVFLMWDAEDLYLAAIVQDDWHIRLNADSPRFDEIPPADALVLTIDPNRDTRSIGRDDGRQEDSEFWIADVENQGRRVVRWDRFRGTARFAEGGAAVVQRDKDKRLTTYEVRLPWAEILPRGQEPAARMVLDLQIVIDDYDEPTDPLPQSRIGWTFGMGTRIDPGLLGSVMLLDVNADDVKSTLRIPKMPPPPRIPEPPVPDPSYWIAFEERLRRHGPEAVTKDTVDPVFAGGEERSSALDELELHLGVFPRVDFLQFQQRIHRRMNRECEGIVTEGLPFYWDHVLSGLRHRVAQEPPAHGFRLFRLPQGGWLVRSRAANFLIDPAGYRVEKALWDYAEFVLLTRPMDLTKRHDQLLLRMNAVEPVRPVLTQLMLNLPSLPANKIPLVVPGVEYRPAGLTVKVLGEVTDEGLVSRSVGYQITWPDGSSLVVSDPALLEEQVAIDRPDVLLLSALHPNARIVGQRVRARLTVLDDVLQCATVPGAMGRVTLRTAQELQRGLQSHESLILAPGESVDSPPPGGGK